MTHPHGSRGVVTLIDNAGEVRLELVEGTQIRFGPGHWIDTRQLFLLASGASSLLDGRLIACHNILPGIDLSVAVREADEAALCKLWPRVEYFIEHWIDTLSDQTLSMGSRDGHDWVCLSRHGMEIFDDVALTIERVWPTGVASAGT